MDDCRRCGAPLTDNGCEYCGDGRMKIHRNLFPEYRMTEEMVKDVAAWDVPEIPMEKLETELSKLNHDSARRYSAFIRGLTKSVEDSNRIDVRWWAWMLLIAWCVGFVAVLANIPKDDPRTGMTLEPGQVEFVSVGTSSLGISVNAGVCDGPTTRPGLRIYNPPGNFYPGLRIYNPTNNYYRLRRHAR